MPLREQDGVCVVSSHFPACCLLYPKRTKYYWGGLNFHSVSWLVGRVTSKDISNRYLLHDPASTKHS